MSKTKPIWKCRKLGMPAFPVWNQNEKLIIIIHKKHKLMPLNERLNTLNMVITSLWFFDARGRESERDEAH